MSPVDVKTIVVAGARIGIVGLDEIFSELKASGKLPSEELAATIVELAGKKNYIPERARGEYGRAMLKEYRRYLGEDVPEERTGLSITILGAGCQACEQLAANVRSALAQIGVAAEVAQVSGLKEIARYNVLGTPALIINGKLRSVGRPLSVQQVVKLLAEVDKEGGSE
jgi:hypothetical protein